MFGSLETLGTACLVLPLVTIDNDTHVFTYPNAIILKDNTGPNVITPSGPIMEFKGYKHASDRDNMFNPSLTGHAGIDRLKHLVTNGLLKGIEYILAISDLKMDTCTDCVLGKMRRLPEPTKRVPRPKHWPYMSIDISGPHKESVQG